MITRDQKYAKTIFEQVSELQKRPPAEQKQYGSMAHKLPVLIRTAGLSQAPAFVAVGARKNSAYGTLLKQLAQTVVEESVEVFLEDSRKPSLGEYMRLTQNSLSA